MAERRVLLACSGSVAAVKLEPLVQRLLADIDNVKVKVVLTEHALHFSSKRDNSNRVSYYTDKDEWETWSKMGDEVLHIELGKWAHVLVIAPLSANSLAKLSNGLCDNLLTCVVRAWDMNKPVFFAPAMNTRMLKHPLTRPQIETLINLGYREIPTVEKLLACGELGDGAMASVDTIVNCVASSLRSSNQLDQSSDIQPQIQQ